MMTSISLQSRPSKPRRTFALTKLWAEFRHDFKTSRLLLLMLIPGAVNLILFKWLPLFGIVTAFQNYSTFQGVLKSPWVGLANFKTFLLDPYCWVLIKNTVILASLTILIGFPIPVLFALLLNEVGNQGIKKTVQSISFFPYFVSATVCVSILYTFLSPQGGLVNNLLKLCGVKPVFFMTLPAWFRPLYITLDVWQHFGYNAIVYIAAIAGIDLSLYEAAEIDGANRWQQMIHVTVPGISNIVITMFILKIGSILSVDVNKILMMYNPSVYSTADVLQTYIYRISFQSEGFPQYSLGTAINLFQSVIAFMLVFITNRLAKRYSDAGIF